MHGKGEIMGRFLKKMKNKQYGQAMAEFALTIPVFLLLVFGVIELSRFFLVYSSVFTASREASRFGSSVGEEGGNKNYLNCNEIAQRAVFSGNFGGVQIDDITISYESTPGDIVAICPDVNFGSVPIDLDKDCSIEYCDYEPVLGHRILVEIVTDFDSLLGIIPDLPVRATNGRTIMMPIGIEKTPEPIDLCADFMEFQNPGLDPVYETTIVDDDTLVVNVENTSENVVFDIFKIENIDWNMDLSTPTKIKEIYLEVDGQAPLLIWISEDGAEPPITIPDVNQYWKINNRIISPKDQSKIKFVFDGTVNIESKIFFEKIIMQNRNIITDFCDLKLD